MKNIVYLIDDKKPDIRAILKKLNELACERNQKFTESQFEFRLIPGTIEGKGDLNIFDFYEDDIIDKIREKKEELADGERMCILLDITLTEEDLKRALSNMYPEADLARKIYFTFYQEMPIYIITVIPWFATQSEVIMGVDLSKQFISKNALLKYEIKEDIEELFRFYEQREAVNV